MKLTILKDQLNESIQHVSKAYHHEQQFPFLQESK